MPAGRSTRRRLEPPNNLYIATGRLTNSREDHLTEFLASALTTSPDFARSYLALLLGGRTGRWGPQRLIEATTQASGFDHAVPDLLLRVSNPAGRERQIAVEHKIDAEETASIRGALVGDLDKLEPAMDPVKQLEHYLTLPGLDGVAYVRESIKPPSPEVLSHSSYIRPTSRDAHFLWREFHPLLERHRHSSLVVGWLADAFVHVGYTMPNASVGDLLSSDSTLRDAARANIRKLWQPMRRRARELGWDSQSGSTHEVYLDNPNSDVKSVWVNPLHHTRLVVRFTPKDNSDRSATRLFEAIQAVLPGLVKEIPLANNPDIAKGLQRRKSGLETVVQVTSSLSDVVADVSDVEEIETRLSKFVVGMLEAVGPARPRSTRAER